MRGETRLIDEFGYRSQTPQFFDDMGPCEEPAEIDPDLLADYGEEETND